MSGVLRSSLSKKISLQKMKDVSKKFKVNYNDLVLGMISKALKEHFIKNNDKSNQVTIVMPFTFNEVPKDPAEYKYLNRFGSVTIYLKLSEDLEKACQLAKRQTDMLKNSLIVVGVFLLMEVY